MRKNTEKRKIPIEIEFTEGYQERFTAAVLKIYAKREGVEKSVAKKEKRETSYCMQ